MVAQDSLTAANPTWPNHNAKFHKESSLMTLAMQKTKGEWNELRTSFLTLLLIPGTFISNSMNRYLVLYVSRYGFLGLKCGCKKDEDGKVVYLNLQDFAADALSFDMVTNLDNWKCRATELVLPTADCPSCRVKLAEKGRGSSLLKFSVQRGVPKMSVHFMQELLKLLSVPLPKPPNEVNVLRVLVEYAFGGQCNADLLKEVFTARNCIREAPCHIMNYNILFRVVVLLYGSEVITLAHNKTLTKLI